MVVNFSRYNPLRHLTTGALCTLLCCISYLSHAQQVDAFARVSLNRRHVFAQQPIKVTVRVYTATWFTEPLDFDNIQIPNAFIIPFSRTMPGMFDIRGKKYAGLEFYYLVFPYKPGSYEIPPIHIVAHTPAVNDYKGVRVNLHTQAEKYEVKDIPNADGSAWFVAKGVSVAERWNKPLDKLKVGDVAERTITIRARGTLPNFIPEPSIDDLAGVSTYRQDPQLIDQRNDQDANGTRVEKVTYLFEKEGAVDIPPITVQWWDPLRQKMMSRHSKGATIHVAPNENLGILATVRDSLSAGQALTPGIAETEKPFTILGMSWQKFSLLLLLSIVAMYGVVRWFIHLVRWTKRRIAWRRQQEFYWYQKFQHSAGKDVIAKFYSWWDRLPGKPSSLKGSDVNAEAVNELIAIEDAWTQHGRPANVDSFKQKIKAERKRLLHEDKNDSGIDQRQQPWL